MPDERRALIPCHANIEYFIGVRLISHIDWKDVRHGILETPEAAREWASANGYYIEKFYDHRRHA